jgi:hypothetical protein
MRALSLAQGRVGHDREYSSRRDTRAIISQKKLLTPIATTRKIGNALAASLISDPRAQYIARSTLALSQTSLWIPSVFQTTLSSTLTR